MTRFPLAAALLCLAACQQAKPPANNAAVANAATAAAKAPVAAPPPAAVNVQAPAAQTPVPVSYDWTFTTHGGSGDLVFGDGDPAEGAFLLTLTCLPGSGEVNAAWEGGANAILSAGNENVALPNGGPLPASHPVYRDFAANGSITLAVGDAGRTLAAKPGAGRTAIESFFAYCAAG